MNEYILAGLKRQRSALNLLNDLLLEEFGLLLARNTDDIVHLEFSIHDLLRQIMTEKTQMIALLDGLKAREHAGHRPEAECALLLEILDAIDDLEQLCARQASRNTELSLSLLDQSRRLLHTVHERLSPRTGDTYGRRGAMRVVRRPAAALLAGRM